MRIVSRSHQSKHFAGFTLVELIIAMALFISVSTIAVGALFSAQSVNARLQSTHVILDGMNLSYELMSRDIRYGSIFYCGNDITLASERSYRNSCPFDISNPNAGGKVIVFKPVTATKPDDRKGYYVNSGKLYQLTIDNTGSDYPGRQITSDDVTIDSLHFFVTGAETSQLAKDNGNTENKPGNSTDILQPVITIVITGKTFVNDKEKAANHYIDFEIETTTSPRGLDF